MAMVIGGVEHQPKGHIGHIDYPIGCVALRSWLSTDKYHLMWLQRERMIQIEQQGTTELIPEQ